jgi:HK97 gp10 family phage protein
MFKVGTRVTIDAQAVVRVVGPQAEQAAYRAAQKVRSRAIANINSLGRVNTGAMKNTIRVRKSDTSTAMARAYTIGSTVPYVSYQEFGTQGHGPRRAKRLVFRIRGRGPLIFAKWVRGVPPGRFMKRAIDATRLSDFTL